MINQTRNPGRGGPTGSFAILVLAAIFSASSGSASDGVFEISHACASQAGCFAGDLPGYPVTVSVTGSYRLTSNLVVPDENTTAIDFALGTNNTSIDFGGFSIVGPGIAGSGSGVRVIGADGIRIFGGSVVGVGDEGIRVGEHSTVSGMLVDGTGGNGISASSRSLISENRVVNAGAIGINASGLGVIVRENIVTDSGGVGISTGSACLVARNVVRNSGSFGLTAFSDFLQLAYANNLLTNNNGGPVNPQVNPAPDITNLGGNVCGDSLAACP